MNDVTLRYQTLSCHEWSAPLALKPKLRTYRLIKESVCCEPYVTFNLDRVDRSFIAQFRLGILPIAVETGRFRNIPLEDRKCVVCDSGQVEDELHFVNSCTLTT